MSQHPKSPNPARLRGTRRPSFHPRRRHDGDRRDLGHPVPAVVGANTRASGDPLGHTDTVDIGQSRSLSLPPAAQRAGRHPCGAATTDSDDPIDVGFLAIATALSIHVNRRICLRHRVNERNGHASSF